MRRAAARGRLAHIDFNIATCNGYAVTVSAAPFPADPALDMAGRQLVMLREMGRMSMEVASASAASAIASAEAAKSILADRFFMPEVGGASARGAKDTAESYHKVTRSLRLTLTLGRTVAEAVRDLRAGVAPRPAGAATGHGATAARLVIDDGPAPDAPRSEANTEGVAAHLERPGAERERLFEIEQAERLPRGSYCRLVHNLAADIGAVVDWETTTVSAPNLRDIAPPAYRAAPVPPPDPPAAAHREMALAP